MKNVLGISAFYHDSAAALVCSGRIVAASQEERFTRKKHDHEFPKNAVEYCLREAGIQKHEIDAVVFYEKPFLKFERLLETYLEYAPRGFSSFVKAMPLWLKQKLFIPKEIDRGLDMQYEGPIYFTRHHESHAASAFFPSPFEKAAVITLDGVGEWTTASWGVGDGNQLTLHQEIQFPHSLGLLYSAFTYYTGFRVNSGEYKVMGLAPYGEPKYAKLIMDHLIDLKEDGSFWIDQSYFDYSAGLRMTNEKFHKLFGAPPRKPESPVTQREMDLAASIQKVTEEIVCKIGKYVHKQTGLKKLCLAGGVALNCVANGKLLRQGDFDDIWVQPAAGDSGGALGAALVGWHMLGKQPRKVTPKKDFQSGSYLGPRYSSDEIRKTLLKQGVAFTEHATEENTVSAIAKLLEEGSVVGHFYGRMEFGPRALGHRSILADPRRQDMQKVLNLKIKFRESFRPFAPSCLKEVCSDYFELSTDSPYMLMVAPVVEARRKPLADSMNLQKDGLARLNEARSDIPAVTHLDYSARVQTVSEDVSPRFYGLLKEFQKRTGCGVLINTSFNIRGEPIVGSPEDAIRCFIHTDMDALVLENFVCLKSQQKAARVDESALEKYKQQFALD